MIVEAFKNDKTILVSMTADELAKLTSFSDTYTMRERMDKHYDYQGFKPSIVGKEFNVCDIYKEARAALDSHKEALTAAEQLKKSASRFLGFFDVSEKNK
jgi:hypothetical protein